MSDPDDRPRDDDQDEGQKINDPLTSDDDDEEAPRETFGDSPKD